MDNGIMNDKKGNAVATVLIIAAMIISATVVLQREVFVTETSHLNRAFSTFEQLVYQNPYQLLERYATAGYTDQTEPYWYCGYYPSPPTLNGTRDNFSSYVQGDFAGRLATISKEFPELGITMTTPNITLDAAETLLGLPSDSATITIEEFNLTFREGDRLITKSLDETETYDTRFWLMYTTLQDWSKCASNDIYGNGLANAFDKKSCAFFKDVCLCSDLTKEFYETECQSPNPPMCCRPDHVCTGPWESETPEDPENPRLLQDFTMKEREGLMREFGVDEGDLQSAADTVAERITAIFAGKNSCTLPALTEPTGIECTAEISNPQLTNVFQSTLVYHETLCLNERAATCGIVTFNEFGALGCAGLLRKALKDSGQMGHGAVAQYMDMVRDGSYSPADCRYQPPDPDRGWTGGVLCDDMVISEDEIKANNDIIKDMKKCRVFLPPSSYGLTGTWAENNDQVYTEDCGAQLEGIDVATPTNIDNSMMNLGEVGVKLLKDRPNPSLRREWYGMNGYIDK